MLELIRKNKRQKDLDARGYRFWFSVPITVADALKAEAAALHIPLRKHLRNILLLQLNRKRKLP